MIGHQSPSTFRVQTLLGCVLGAGAVVCPNTAVAQTPATPGPCKWTITAAPPVNMVSQGSDAIFMLIGNATMVMLTGADATVGGGGTITASDVNGTGTYDVGAAQGAQNQGAVLTIENQRGELLGLGTGDGQQGYPPPAKLEVTHFSANEIRGELKDTFWVQGTSRYGPPQFAHVLVKVVFSARSMTSAVGCK